MLYIFDLIFSSFLHFLCFRNIYSSSSSIQVLSEHPHFSFFALFQPSSPWLQMLKQNDIITMTSEFSNVHSLKAAIFHTMAFKLSLEIHKNKITPKCLIDFLKVLYNVTQLKKKITFEQYSRIHLQGPKIAICETASNVVFVLNSSFNSKDQYFCTAFQEATDAFNNMLKDFGYTQKLELYDPIQHQTHPPSQNSLFQ